MLVNLLSNAAKFTPPGGLIKIDGRMATLSEQQAAGCTSIGNKNIVNNHSSNCNVDNNNNFNVHNSSCSGLAVDLDGSNGLLAHLGRRRALTTGRNGNINHSGRGIQTCRLPTTATSAQHPEVAGVYYPREGEAITRVMVLMVKDSGPGIPPADVARYNKLCAVVCCFRLRFSCPVFSVQFLLWLIYPALARSNAIL